MNKIGKSKYEMLRYNSVSFERHFMYYVSEWPHVNNNSLIFQFVETEMTGSEGIFFFSMNILVLQNQATENRK